jgi:hypothetical protein
MPRQGSVSGEPSVEPDQNAISAGTAKSQGCALGGRPRRRIAGPGGRRSNEFEWGASMKASKRYVVTFFKTVTNDYGRDHEIRQRAIEVFAVDEADALTKAKRELCRLEHLGDWSQHADRYEVEQPDFPS